MKPETAVQYASQVAAYECHRAELERKYRGQIALLHGDELLGAFPTREKALALIIERFGRPEPCLLQEIGQPLDLKPLWGLPEEDGPLPEEEPPKIDLSRELAAYERHRAELERNQRGQFALVHGDTLIGVFNTALSSGVDVRIMRYEDNKASPSRAGRTDACAGRFSAPLPRP
ncbi:MAG TPA: hypothetical protein VKA46_00065, partial [Gemmataceae bacterium]|nr:hypothetical protein [Gemmataceae bacterium]